VNRRRFVSTAAGVLAALPVRPAWPLQAVAQPARGPESGPRWLPSAELLRTLPRLLELAAVPGLALASVDGGRVFL
jgi:hypothetical protein